APDTESLIVGGYSSGWTFAQMRGKNMTKARWTTLIVSLILTAAEITPAAIAADAQTPIGPRWWPSEWGAADQRGAANRLSGEKVLEAKQLIRQGKTYSVGRVYEQGIPLPGKRHFSLTIPGSPTYPPAGKNQGVFFDE